MRDLFWAAHCVYRPAADKGNASIFIVSFLQAANLSFFSRFYRIWKKLRWIRRTNTLHSIPCYAPLFAFIHNYRALLSKATKYTRATLEIFYFVKGLIHTERESDSLCFDRVHYRFTADFVIRADFLPLFIQSFTETNPYREQD